MKEGRLKEYSKLLRLHFMLWAIIPIIGALTVKGQSVEISDICILFFIGLISTTAGHVFNDYKDYKIDKHSRYASERPLVKGTIPRKNALIICLIITLINFIVVVIFYPYFWPILIRIITFFTALLYNITSKKFIGADIFAGGSVALLCLFGAVAVLDHSQGIFDISYIAWIVIGLIFIQGYFYNAIEGGLKDIENDTKTKTITVPILFKVKQKDNKIIIPNDFKIFALSLKIFTIIIVFLPFIFFSYGYNYIQIFLLINFSFWMLISTIQLLRMKIFDRKKIGYYNQLQEGFCYFLLPILLFTIIGIYWTAILFVYPIIWSLFFKYIVYGKSFGATEVY